MRCLRPAHRFQELLGSARTYAHWVLVGFVKIAETSSSSSGTGCVFGLVWFGLEKKDAEQAPDIEGYTNVTPSGNWDVVFNQQ